MDVQSFGEVLCWWADWQRATNLPWARVSIRRYTSIVGKGAVLHVSQFGIIWHNFVYEVELLSILYFRNFYRVLKSRVDNYFKENNIVSVHSKLEIHHGVPILWYTGS